jgi:hypothetical protein
MPSVASSSSSKRPTHFLPRRPLGVPARSRAWSARPVRPRDCLRSDGEPGRRSRARALGAHEDELLRPRPQSDRVRIHVEHVLEVGEVRRRQFQYLLPRETQARAETRTDHRPDGAGIRSAGGTASGRSRRSVRDRSGFHHQAAARAIAPPEPAPRLARRRGGLGENRAQIGEEGVVEERIRLTPLQ